MVRCGGEVLHGPVMRSLTLILTLTLKSSPVISEMEL